MKKIFWSLLLASASISTFSESRVYLRRNGTESYVTIYNKVAEDLFDGINVKERKIFKCLKYVYGGAQNTDAICREYSETEVIAASKTVHDVISCKKDLVNSNKSECNFSAGGYDDLMSGEEVLLTKTNEFAPLISHLPNHTFKSASGSLVISCSELIVNRYYDCFIEFNGFMPTVGPTGSPSPFSFQIGTLK